MRLTLRKGRFCALAWLPERGRFDALFTAGGIGANESYGGNIDAAPRHGIKIPMNDPFMLVPAMAQATRDGKALHPGDAGSPAAVILDRIVAALTELGGGPEHVVETRICSTDIATWQDVGRAHGRCSRTFAQRWP